MPSGNRTHTPLTATASPQPTGSNPGSAGPSGSAAGGGPRRVDHRLSSCWTPGADDAVRRGRDCSPTQVRPDESECRLPGTTSSPTCPVRPAGGTRARSSLPVPTTSPLFRWSDPPEVSMDRFIRFGAVQDVYRLAAQPAVPAHRLERPRDAGAHLLQVRGRQPGGQPQAQHRRAAGVLQRQGRHPEAHHRDRRRPMGHRAGLRLRPVRHGVRGLAGRGQLRPEAVPAPHDRGLRRPGPPVAVAPHRRRAPVPRRGPAPPRLARHRHLRGRGGRRPGRGDPLLAGQRPQPRPAAPDRHRRGGPAPAGQGGRVRPRRDRGLHRWRLQLRGPGLPVPAGEAGREHGAHHPPSSRLLPSLTGACTSTTSATAPA